MALSPGTRLGRYIVNSLLGAGGMGEVYLAEDPVLARRVALKVLHGDRQDEDLLRRFEQEALAASALNHPHILTVYEFGTDNGTHFLACEYVQGISVRERLRQSGGALPIADVVQIGLQTATALAAAHDAGIVHRDIKPENLMVRTDGYVKVLDFGLAKRTTDLGPLADARTVMTSMPGMILGTVVYMSPEQARGAAVDARSDVWSLGCVLYEMVSGRTPFDGESPLDVLAAVLDRQPPEIARARPDCPPALVALIDRMLLKDRNARIQSMSVVAGELRSLSRELEGARAEPVHAGTPASTVGVAAVPPLRRRRITLAAGVLATAIAVVAAIVAWNRSGAERSTRDAAHGAAATAPPAANAPVAARTVQFWLSVQRDRKDPTTTFETTGDHNFGKVDRFRLHVISSAPGRFYVLNEGPDEGGRRTLAVLHLPLRDTSAAATNAALGWYNFTPHAGTEHLWLVYSPDPVPQLEGLRHLVNPLQQGRIDDPQQVQVIKGLLENHQVLDKDITTNAARARTTLQAHAGLITHLLKLEHD